MSAAGTSGESGASGPAGTGGKSRNGGNGGNGGNGHHHPPPPPDPGPPAILVEIIPQNLIPFSDPDTMAKFIDSFQNGVSSFAATLQSVGLVLAGPSVATDFNSPPDNSPILRVGVWLLPPTFPFAPQDPQHPHQLPLLTPADAALGFSQAEVLGVFLKPVGSGPALSVPIGGFSLSIPITTFNTLAAVALPAIQAKAAAASGGLVTVSSVTVTSSRPSDSGLVGGNVVTTVEGSAGLPSGSFSGTITETLSLIPVALPDTVGTISVPTVAGVPSVGTDVVNQVLAGAAAILGGSNLLGAGFFIEAIGITVGGQAAAVPVLGSAIALVTTLVSMLPTEVPFEPGKPGSLPGFPELNSIVKK